MRPNDPVVTLTGTKLGETEKAVKFDVTHISGAKLEKSTTQWFPLSQIAKMGTDSKKVGEDYLMVSQWIMDQKKLSAPTDVQEDSDEDSGPPWESSDIPF